MRLQETPHKTKSRESLPTSNRVIRKLRLLIAALALSPLGFGCTITHYSSPGYSMSMKRMSDGRSETKVCSSSPKKLEELRRQNCRDAKAVKDGDCYKCVQ